MSDEAFDRTQEMLMVLGCEMDAAVDRIAEQFGLSRAEVIENVQFWAMNAGGYA